MLQARRLLSLTLAFALASAPVLEAAPWAARTTRANQKFTPVPRLNFSSALTLPAQLLAPPSIIKALALPAAPIAAQQKAPEAQRPTPMGELISIAEAKDPARTAAFRFDNSKPKKPGDNPDGGTPGRQSPTDPSLKKHQTNKAQPHKPVAFSHLNDATAPRSTAEKWFERTLLLGLIAGIAAPIAYGVTPIHTILFTVPVALVPALAAFIAIAAIRVIRYLRRGPVTGKPQGPPRRLRAGLLGLALGFSVGAAPTVFNAPIVELGARFIDPEAHVRMVHGPTLRRETLRILSRNPVGKGVLEKLRDRGERFGLPSWTHLPAFFISNQEDTRASFKPFFDGIFIARSELAAHGWKDEAFLRNSKLQAEFAWQFATISVHELEHDVQFRRSVWYPEQFKVLGYMEPEWEAFMTSHFFVHAALSADPSAGIPNGDLGNYITAVDNLDKYLRSLSATYPDNKPHESRYYTDYLINLRANWPAHRVEAYTLLAKRYLPKSPKMARFYYEKASAVAKRYKLHPPAPLAIPEDRPNVVSK